MTKAILALFAAIAIATSAAAQTPELVTEEMMVKSPDAGVEIFVRNKRPAAMTTFRPERTVLFVHGATYPAHTSFDLKLDGRSWMDYINGAGKPYYDPAQITVPTLLVLGEWDRDTPPYMAQTLFPLLVNAPGKRFIMLPEGTHTIMMEKNRLELFRAVQGFLDEAGGS